MFHSHRKQIDRTSFLHHGAWDLSITWGSAELIMTSELGGSTLGKKNHLRMEGRGKGPPKPPLCIYDDNWVMWWLYLKSSGFHFPLAKLQVSKFFTLPPPLSVFCHTRSSGLPRSVTGRSKGGCSPPSWVCVCVCVCERMVWTPQHALGGQRQAFTSVFAFCLFFFFETVSC